MTRSDELDLDQVVRGLWRRRARVLLATVLGGLLGVVTSTMTPRRWEAFAVIQLSQVGQVGQVGMAATQVVEPVGKTIERVKSREFRTELLRRLAKSSSSIEEGREETLFRSSLVVEQAGTTDLVHLRVRGYSREFAVRSLEVSLEVLKESVAKLAEPTVARLRQQLAQITESLEHLRSELDELNRLRQAGDRTGAGKHFSESVYLANLIATHTSDIRGLEVARLTLEEQLSPERTYPVSFFERPHARRSPVSPRWTRNVGLGLLGGFIAGLLYAGILAIRQS